MKAENDNPLILSRRVAALAISDVEYVVQKVYVVDKLVS